MTHRGSLIPKVEGKIITDLIFDIDSDARRCSPLFKESQRPLFETCQRVAEDTLKDKPRYAVSFMDLASFGYLALEKAISEAPETARAGIHGMPFVANINEHRERVRIQADYLLSDYRLLQPVLMQHVHEYGKSRHLNRYESSSLVGIAAFIHNVISYELESQVLESWYQGPSAVLLDGTNEVN